MKHNDPKKVIRNLLRNRSLPKAPTGIQGLDELTGDGLPQGRPTLLCGSADCGKTPVADWDDACGARVTRRLAGFLLVLLVGGSVGNPQGQP